MRVAVCAVVGRPSSGKSSLINCICGQKISIVSAVPQTTRNRIRAIYTNERGQLIFLDTPGYHASSKKINLRLIEIARESLAEADLILYVVDTSRPGAEEEHLICELVKPLASKTVVACNKIDLKTAQLAASQAFIASHFQPLAFRAVSALSGEGKEGLLDQLFAYAKEGDLLYPEEFYTDQPVEFRISELVREQVFKYTRQEIPHSSFVEIADLQFKDEGQTLWVRGFICVERESQKGIVIGKKGELIKKIVASAMALAQEIFPYKVELDFRVRVRPRWRRNDKLLKKLIY